MSMDYEAAQRAMEAVLFSGCGIAEGMRRLFDYGQRVHPSETWRTLASWDWTRESGPLAAWLGGVLERTPPLDDVDCLYFGVYFPERDDGQTLPVVYVAGTTRYDEEEWTPSPEWTPEGMDFESRLLVDAERLLAQGGDELLELGDYLACLGYVALVAIDLCSRLPREALVGDRDDRWVTIGFEAGDWFNLGLLDHSGAPLGTKTSPDSDGDASGEDDA